MRNDCWKMKELAPAFTAGLFITDMIFRSDGIHQDICLNLIR